VRLAATLWQAVDETGQFLHPEPRAAAVRHPMTVRTEEGEVFWPAPRKLRQFEVESVA